MAVRFAELEVRLGNLRRESECAVDDMKCELEVEITFGGGKCQRLVLVDYKLHLTWYGFAVVVETTALKVQV